MKRGRIFIYLALIIIIALGAGGAYLWMHRPTTPTSPSTNQPTQAVTYVEIVTAGQNIPPGTLITEAMLSTIQIPANTLVAGLKTNKADVVNMYAKYLISQGVPITDSMISVTPGNVSLSGSAWALSIPQGLTAVSIPITRLSSVAYGIRDGDYVNIIVTMLIVDVDPSTQTLLPNLTSSVVAPGVSSEGTQTLTAEITSGGPTSIAGRTEVDSTLNQPLYLIPSEDQRPRLVTQTILQKVQVLHVGNFPLPGETSNLQFGASGEPTPTPTPSGQQAPAPVSIVRPDIITLMVPPQDVNTLIYLVNSGAKITLALRNPNDTSPAATTDAAMLEYLLTQYNIPIPAKLPYSLNPRLDVLRDPVLANDATPAP
jgi:pilus assembly protein CpaB